VYVSIGGGSLIKLQPQCLANDVITRGTQDTTSDVLSSVMKLRTVQLVRNSSSQDKKPKKTIQWRDLFPVLNKLNVSLK
jgi:hypothetical protein